VKLVYHCLASTFMLNCLKITCRNRNGWQSSMKECKRKSIPIRSSRTIRTRVGIRLSHKRHCLNKLKWRLRLKKRQGWVSLSIHKSKLKQFRSRRQVIKVWKNMYLRCKCKMNGKEILIFKENNTMRYTKSLRAWIITSITFVKNNITHKSASKKLSKHFIAFMRRQMNKINSSKGMHVKIMRMLLIKMIIRSLKFQNTRG